ncbi:MAG: MotA/TolQ/ExbB proton channel family protein [Cyclobacteriaceae bacterium]|jgi:hypothetical protein|nr:MotA/TolQ/ExbB proton channel family protein [Cyclobacteriaceae bacterium]
MSISEFHLTGGIVFMVPITLMFVILLGIAAFVVLSQLQKKTIGDYWLESIKQIGGLAAVWGTWSTLIGLFQAFGALEAAKDVIPFPVICGGMKVALITVLYGLAVYCVALFLYIIIKLSRLGSKAA